MIYNAVKESINWPTQVKWKTVSKGIQESIGGTISVTKESLSLFWRQNRGFHLFTGGRNGSISSLNYSSMLICKAGLCNYVLNPTNELKEDKHLRTELMTISHPVKENISYSTEYVVDKYFQLFISQIETELII